jgi:hypothetical protein
MSILIPGVQTNPASFSFPLIGQASLLTTDASGIPVGDSTYPTPAGLKAGLYAIVVRNTANGIGINSVIYYNGVNFSSGGLAQNNTANLTVYTAAPYTQIGTTNTSGAAILAGIQLIPLSLGEIPGMS